MLNQTQPTPGDRTPRRPPMDAAEYRMILTSQVLRLVFTCAVMVAAIAIADATNAPLGSIPSALGGFVFGYCLGAKFFPDSGAVIGRRFRNYRRAKRGRPLIDEGEVPKVGYIDDFRRG